MRGYIIDTVGEIGGHFGANLGTVEITVALHSLLTSPRDKILWDVGHQAYAHKILTGRRDQLPTIRKYEGLAPFCSIFESEHDIMGAGHASTAIGYAVGLKEAMRRGHGDDGNVVAVIGDGAMTGGVAFEAITQAGGLGTPIVVLFNDNGMSIAPNVGALSSYFNRVRLNPKLWHAREDVEAGLTKLPAARPHLRALRSALQGVTESVLVPRPLVGGARLGLCGCRRRPRRARRASRPARGAGRAAPRRRALRHGQGQGLRASRGWRPGGHGEVACRQAEVDRQRGSGSDHRRSRWSAGPAAAIHPGLRRSARRASARRDDRVIGITAAMNSGTGLNILQRELPDRYFDVGIAEQQAVLFAAGMALQGCRPVVAIYSTFLQRAFDQIVHDVCLQKLNVTFAMDRAGLVGDDGPTHHGAFDIAYLRCLPNIVLMAPRDEAMLVNMLHTALTYDDGPIALRYPRGEGVGVPLPASPRAIPIGTGEILREGQRVALLALR